MSLFLDDNMSLFSDESEEPSWKEDSQAEANLDRNVWCWFVLNHLACCGRSGIIKINSGEEESEDDNMRLFSDESKEPSGKEDSQAEANLDRIQSFRCPISFVPMKHPVLCDDGYTYEHDLIEHWLEDKNSSPMTRETLASKVFRKNYALMGAMKEFSPDSEETQRNGRKLKLRGHFICNFIPLI